MPAYLFDPSREYSTQVTLVSDFTETPRQDILWYRDNFQPNTGRIWCYNISYLVDKFRILTIAEFSLVGFVY